MTVAVLVTPVNDAPVVAVNTGLMVSEGDSVLLTPNHLKATDVDNPSAGLVYTFEAQPSPLHGVFRLAGNPLSMDSSFTQQDIDSGRVSFAHDGSETTLDSIGFFISDSAGGTTHMAYFEITIVPVNDPPVSFELLMPADGDTARIVNDSLSFAWHPSEDAESDSLEYIFHLLGAGSDTTITGLADTAFVFGGAGNLQPDSLYTWYLEVTDRSDTTESVSRNLFRVVLPALAVEPGDLLPAAFALHQNYPNPFNPSTTLQFDLPMATDILIVVYDLLGREVVRLVDQRLEPGYHQLVWNGGDRRGRPVPTGMYIVLMATPQFTKSIKMVLLK